MRRPFPVKATVVACGAVSLDPPRFHSHSERARLAPCSVGSDG